MKNRLFPTREMVLTAGAVAAIVAALQARSAITGLETGPVLATAAAVLIALILTLVASAPAR